MTYYEKIQKIVELLDGDYWEVTFRTPEKDFWYMITPLMIKDGDGIYRSIMGKGASVADAVHDWWKQCVTKLPKDSKITLMDYNCERYFRFENKGWVNYGSAART